VEQHPLVALYTKAILKHLAKMRQSAKIAYENKESSYICVSILKIRVSTHSSNRRSDFSLIVGQKEETVMQFVEICKSLQNRLRAISKISSLVEHCEARGYEIKALPNSHYQINVGNALFNYYPRSKRKTLYINGTNQGINDCSVYDVIKIIEKKVDIKLPKTKKISNKVFKESLYKDTKVCFYCGLSLSFSDATVDHIMPLSKGGLNNRNNVCLCCYKCNSSKGSSVPW